MSTAILNVNDVDQKVSEETIAEPRTQATKRPSRRNSIRLTNGAIYKTPLANFRDLRGEKTWQLLIPAMLSDDAKEVVNEDPDLGQASIEKLIELQGGTLRQLPPMCFGIELDENGKDIPKAPRKKENTIGVAALSYCININQRATWAEIVARYAALVRLPFVEVAVFLKKVYEANGNGFTRYDNNYNPTMWQPREAKFDRYSLRRESNVITAWASLSAEQRKIVGKNV